MIDQIANQFIEILDSRYARESIEEWPWENVVWSSEKISWAHLQKYYHSKANILHLVIMPVTSISAPIYGFDLIELNGNLTGLFLDYTPTVGPEVQFTSYEFANPRPVPEWGDFFSSNFVCCKPEDHEIPYATATLEKYIELLESVPHDLSIVDRCKTAQNVYIEGQRKNPQTRRMITAHYSESIANQFISEVLFPLTDK